MKRLLAIPHHDRLKSQKSLLINYFKNVKFFSEMIPASELDTYEQLSEVVGLKNIEIGTTLFNEGEAGDLFYIVLQGEVEILKACKVYIDVGLDQVDTLSGDGSTK